MYVELHAASAFSFLEAASSPEALVDRAAELGYAALALVDRDGVYGMPRFHKAALAAGIRPIVGCELTVRQPASGGFSAAGGESAVWRLPVLVESRQGYRNLCRLITRMKLRAPKGGGALTLDELEGATGGLVALAGREALAARAFGVGGLVDRLIGLFGRSNVYIELQRHCLRDEEAENEVLIDLASAFHVPVVATNGVRFGSPDERPLADVLTCIRHRTDLARAGRRLARNAERYLKPPSEMARLFADRPEAVAATTDLAARLGYTLADLGYRFPAYPVPAGETMGSFLRKITEVGARERYRPYHERARTQIARELDLIEKLDLAGYFLIVWDIVNFCRQQGILVQGRGSAANSAVCYSLGITAVDPVGMDLLFERFLSEERGEWPDIDLDLPSGDRRERVIQYVYEKYGSHGAAMTANVVTYRGRSAARELGKVLGFEAAEIDRLARVMNRFEFRDTTETLDRHLRQVGFDVEAPRVRLFADLWRRMQDLPRHLGQHSGGMVICDGELDAIVPLEKAAMPGRVVVQWDKDDCADMGIVKIDLLGLGMMAVIQDALETINRSRLAAQCGPCDPLRTEDCEPGSATGPGSGGTLSPESLELWTIPPDDPVVYQMLQQADTVGVFQVESRAQMATLPRMRPERFYDLVVEVALIRPGPIVGQMVHPYLNRRAGREAVTYPHPSLEPILKRTLGVPLFQEQILRIAMVAAGFSGGQAEQLRRAFSFKRSERRMKQVEIELWEGMARQGITGEAAAQIVKAITSFALYGFPESHAASFALIAYASAYLRAHYPAAFTAALLNNQPMGFYHPATIVKDAQRHGVRFAPIDVEQSAWDCVVDGSGAVRLGLRYVAGLRSEVGMAIQNTPRTERAVPAAPRAAVEEPPSAPALVCPMCRSDDRSMIEVTERGDRLACFCNTCAHNWIAETRPLRRFRSLEDLIAKTGVNRQELATLAEIGALNSFGYDRREALWQIERAIRPAGELFQQDSGWLPVARGQEAVAGGQGPMNSGQGSGDGGRWLVTGSEWPMDEEQLPGAGGWWSDLSGQDGERGPLAPMSAVDRLVADYAGTGLTIGPHPMTMYRAELALRGVVRASELPRERDGRRVRVAGAVITRQRPGTAKGFVFLTLEDETGIANVIVRPDLFDRERLAIIEASFLLVEGRLQNLDGVCSVRADRLTRLDEPPVRVETREFR